MTSQIGPDLLTQILVGSSHFYKVVSGGAPRAKSDFLSVIMTDNLIKRSDQTGGHGGHATLLSVLPSSLYFSPTHPSLPSLLFCIFILFLHYLLLHFTSRLSVSFSLSLSLLVFQSVASFSRLFSLSRHHHYPLSEDPEMYREPPPCLAVIPTDPLSSTPPDEPQTVEDLRTIIYASKRSWFLEMEAENLILWSVAFPLALDNQYLPISLDNVPSAIKLAPIQKLSDIFPKMPPQDTIHIIVQGPPTGNAYANTKAFPRLTAKLVVWH